MIVGLSKKQSSFTLSVLKKCQPLRLSISLVLVIMVASAAPLMFIGDLVIEVEAAAQDKPLPTVNTIPIGPSTIGQDGKEGDFTTQAALGSVSARPTNNIVNTKSFYDVVFVTGKAGVIKKIEVTFPAGTTVPSSASFNEAEGIGPGTVSKSGQTLTYNVANAVNVPIGTKIRLEFTNINNPLIASASYKVTVTTRNSVNTIIDGPTQSAAYTIKQIGSNAIADGAIKLPTDTQFGGDEISVSPQASNTGTASCPPGRIAISGGNFVSTASAQPFMQVLHSFKSSSTTWSVTMYNSHTTSPFSFQALVNCLPQSFP
jgi:hypothetical protein